MATQQSLATFRNTPRTVEIIEATAPEAERKMSLDTEAHAGLAERKYGLEARVTPGVTFEEYRHWARVERQLEIEANNIYKAERGRATAMSVVKGRFSKGVHHDNAKSARNAAPVNTTGEVEHFDEKGAMGEIRPVAPASVSDEEWRTAARALRTASWGTIFYVMTTDILGWGSTPNVFASVGFGAGVALYVIFGLAAGASGWMIWRTFLGLDSARYPMLSFGDPFYRIMGPRARHFINVTQSIQQFMSVAVLLLGQSQVLYQLADYKLCFIAGAVIIMVVGMISGSIRSLQRLGWLCNASVWLNVVSFIIIMAAAATHPPDTKLVNGVSLIKTNLTTGPIQTFAGPPPPQLQEGTTNEFAAQFNGVDSMVYSYSGAILFVAFLAEMRHPLDFWKGMVLAQMFICFVYIFFGAFVYAYYGQYAYTSISQVVGPASLQIVSNALSLVTGFIAIFLYFNIGMKTVYLEVGQELLHFPPIITKRGRFLWYALGPFYWIVAFIVGASVPNLFGIANVVGGLFSVNFTYSLPAFMYATYKIQTGAKLPGEGFDPITGVTTREDSGMGRYWRGYRKTVWASTGALLFGFAGLATSGMGTWGAIIGLIQLFGPGGQVATSWGCVLA